MRTASRSGNPAALIRSLDQARDLAAVLQALAAAVDEQLAAQAVRIVVWTDEETLLWSPGTTAGVLPDDVAAMLQARLGNEVRSVVAMERRPGDPSHDAAVAALGSGCVVPVALDGRILAAIGCSLPAHAGAPGVAEVEFFDTLAALAASALRRVMHERAARHMAGRLEHTERLLAETRECLVERDRLAGLGELLADVAHELGTPIGCITANVGPLDDTLRRMGPTCPDVARARSLVAVIARGAERAAAGLCDLRQAARGPGLAAPPVDVHDAIELALRLLAHRWPSRITVARHFGSLPRLAVDPIQLNQVLMNLLANAGDAIADRGSVCIRTRTSADAAVIEVEDDGAGIMPEHLPHVFEPFFTTKDAQRGTGLGLAISHRIVELHGGRLTVASDVGRGTVFRMTFPHPR
ncbi:MAG TPA: ATP-binding protein [Candidatus Binatia bacterium]|jgi:signal transduction histidine kinase|nr:ATP-binding protein [Candidatus Binatia bacterium]